MERINASASAPSGAEEALVMWPNYYLNPHELLLLPQDLSWGNHFNVPQPTHHPHDAHWNFPLPPVFYHPPHQHLPQPLPHLWNNTPYSFGFTHPVNHHVLPPHPHPYEASHRIYTATPSREWWWPAHTSSSKVLGNNDTVGLYVTTQKVNSQPKPQNIYRDKGVSDFGSIYSTRPDLHPLSSSLRASPYLMDNEVIM
jgi:hypothetical protein